MKLKDIDWIEPNEVFFELWEAERRKMRRIARELGNEAAAYIKRVVNRHRKTGQSKIYRVSGIKKSDCPDNVRKETRRKFEAYVDQYEEAHDYLRSRQVSGCPPQLTDKHPTLKKNYETCLDTDAEKAHKLYKYHRRVQLKIESSGARLYVILR